jgi:hypothetical protein
MSHVCGQLVGSRFRCTVGNVADVFLRRPKRNVHNQTAMLVNHQPGGVSRSDVMCANSRGKHRVPSPERLLPKGYAPGELAVFDHPLVPGPDVIHQNIKATALVENSLSGCFNF